VRGANVSASAGECGSVWMDGEWEGGGAGLRGVTAAAAVTPRKPGRLQAKNKQVNWTDRPCVL